MSEAVLTAPPSEPVAALVAADRERIDATLTDFLAESRRRHAANPHLRPVYDRAAEFVLHGGKRLRPRLVLAAYRVLAGDPEPPAPVWRAAASLELFHAFMLVHDDLIDGSTVRRDRPTLPEALRLDADDPSEPAAARLGSDLALVGGDLLCALGMRLLAQSGLPDAVAGAVHRLVADVLLETGAGQLLDVLYGTVPLRRVSEPQIIDAYLRKTARYSVSGPLVLGATLAQAPAAAQRSLRRFGDLLGLGYQLQNDLDALQVDPELGENADLDGGKRTWVLWMAYHRQTAAGRTAIDRALAGPAGPGRRAVLHELIAGSGAIAAAQERVRTLRADAVATLREAALSPAQHQALLALAALFAPAEPAPAPVLAPALDPFALATASAIDLSEKATA